MNLAGLPVHQFEHDGSDATGAFMLHCPTGNWDKEKNCPREGTVAVVGVWGDGRLPIAQRLKWKGDKERSDTDHASWDFVPWLDPRNQRDIDGLTDRVTNVVSQHLELMSKRLKSLELKMGKVAARVDRLCEPSTVPEAHSDPSITEPAGVASE